MEDNLINSIQILQKDGNWQEIVEKYHSHPDRSRVLWVFPSADNLEFVKNVMEELQCDKILSVGCGSGLLEWIISEATGLQVSGLEVDGAWWHSKYAPPTFIPLLLTSTKLEKDTIHLLNNSNSTALLFCYFNNQEAFRKYLENYSGNVLIIIGPDGKGVHTEPKPFENLDNWCLYKWQEIRDSKDFIVFYCRNNSNNNYNDKDFTK